MNVDFITTRQAAERLGLSVLRVQQLIQQGRIPATRIGRDWMIRPADLEAFAAQPRRVGYPKGRPRRTTGPGE